ncbi:pentatricopeptide repeat-containing protein At3g12770-like [Malania oleifera]|uniref:pentatricopeptide repeat-containing protein At3g12770-like n=1 Tax=Malania oleifera TaxID=397392 RepID=UPI0025AE272D|nr:pentatricopeptide repeat-containing protein At3g12770-like [Malania oleifera]
MHWLRRRVVPSVLTRSAFTSLRFLFGGGLSIERRRDSYDYTHLLQQCRTAKSIKKLHAQIITGGFEQNPFLATKLVGKYAEHGGSNMEDARKVFDFLHERDDFLWNTMIQGYANSGPFVEALNVYDEMRSSGVSANRYTYPNVLKSCGAMKDGKKGRIVHGHVVKSGFEYDLFVGNALVSFYAKSQDIGTSRKVFDEMPQRDLVSWNSMISGYTINGYVEEALVLFHALLQNKSIPAPDNATLVGVLPACAQAAAIQEGMWIHSYTIKSGMEIDAALGSGLISMYANCGRFSSAQDVFNRVCDKNIVVWNAMIRCYGMHGRAEEALELFSQLVESGLRPDGVIFSCLLSTCSHAGMVAKGWELFKRMPDYGVERNDQHYACMVDLLGRTGFLDEAVEFMKTMPKQAGKDAYGALLGACRIHNRLELAEEIAEKLFVLDPDNAGRYIILAKMYEDVGQWEDAARVRKVLREKNIRKPLGCSSIELDGILQTFGVEDESHPFTEQIFYALERLDGAMEEDNGLMGLHCLISGI